MKRILAFLTWVLYQTLRLIFGLVVHPYRTTREIMRGKWFVPLVLLPSGILFWIIVTGRVAAWMVDINGVWREVVAMGFATFIVSMVFWQGLLLYLGIRFGVGLRR